MVINLRYCQFHIEIRELNVAIRNLKVNVIIHQEQCLFIKYQIRISINCNKKRISIHLILTNKIVYSNNTKL